MKRSITSYLFIVALLFAGIESAIDSVGEEHAHVQDHSHIVDTDDSPSSAQKHSDDQCQHSCHGHSSIPANLLAAQCVVITDPRFSIYAPHVLNFAQAPPTPPPTA